MRLRLLACTSTLAIGLASLPAQAQRRPAINMINSGGWCGRRSAAVRTARSRWRRASIGRQPELQYFTGDRASRLRHADADPTPTPRRPYTRRRPRLLDANADAMVAVNDSTSFVCSTADGEPAGE